MTDYYEQVDAAPHSDEMRALMEAHRKGEPPPPNAAPRWHLPGELPPPRLPTAEENAEHWREYHAWVKTREYRRARRAARKAGVPTKHARLVIAVLEDEGWCSQ